MKKTVASLVFCFFFSAAYSPKAEATEKTGCQSTFEICIKSASTEENQCWEEGQQKIEKEMAGSSLKVDALKAAKEECAKKAKPKKRDCLIEKSVCVIEGLQKENAQIKQQIKDMDQKLAALTGKGGILEKMQNLLDGLKKSIEAVKASIGDVSQLSKITENKKK